MANVLRYPYEALTETTDYLQIDIVKYQSVAEKTGELVSNFEGTSQRRNQNSSATAGLTATKNLSRSTLDLVGTILLPMPSNIQDGNSVSYADDSLNGIVAAAVAPITDVMLVDLSKPDAIKTKFGNTINKLGSIIASEDVRLALNRTLAAQAVNIFGGNVTPDQILARQKGEIFNPNMELLFNGVTLRSFKFSFKLTPREELEAEQIKFIIRSLKKNMSPQAGTSKFYLKTPNIFELTFKSGTVNHPFLNNFKQCALTDISVNYTGENVYATYGGNLKAPISMIMDLTFKELEPVYNEDYDDNAPGVGY